MYRHFALVTVLLTASVAMFADGENREVAAARTRMDADPPVQRERLAPPATPSVSRRASERHERFVQSGGFDGFDASFGTPMDKAMGSLATRANRLAPEIAQTGYSEAYLASLDATERELLLDGLQQEGMLSPGERERRTAALIAASEARSGASPTNH
jgi:hypothetical protein